MLSTRLLLLERNLLYKGKVAAGILGLHMLEIRVTSNIKQISKQLSGLAYKEVPFATARALTELAQEVQQAERTAMESVFDKPKPFTLNSVRVFGATKDSLTAGVFVKDRAASYLSPFEDGGEHFLSPGQTKLHVPVQAPKDAGGNVPRNFERNRRGGAGVFFGVVQTKRGPINGMWQRTVRYEVRDRRGNAHTSRTGKLRRGWSHASASGKPRKISGLRLLVRYEDNKPVTQNLDFQARAKKLVESRFDAVFGRELAKAIASSKLKVG